MNEIKVSIIVPVYNTAKYLEKCLESLMNQTLKDIEIICVDDGSTDNSLNIAKKYSQNDSRIRILKQNHKKQGAARNYGISEAKGEYVGFVDSDDWCEKDMFEKLYFRAKNTNSDITMCAVSIYNENTNTSSQSDTYRNLDIFPSTFFDKVFSPANTYDFFFDICANPVNKLYRRSFLKENNLKFRENIYFEDIPFFFDVWLSAERISLIKDFLYTYRMFAENSTCFSNDINKIDNIKTLKYRENVLKKHKLYKRLKKEYKKYKKKSLLLWFNKIKDRRAKILYFLFMFIQMPSCTAEPLQILKKELNLYIKILLNKDKKIFFWGASIFLANFLKKYKINDNNIIGIIDKDSAKQNTEVCGYMVCAPEKLREIKTDKIIITIINFPESSCNMIKEFLKENNLNNINVELV